MLFSSTYFGTIPYFQELVKHEQIIIDCHETYKKQTWRNRTEILDSNGPLLLSVPVFRPHGSNSKMHEVKIMDTVNWRKDHWKAIYSSYQHAPFFFYYKNTIKDLIYNKEPSLIRYNYAIFKQLLDWLDFDIQVDFSLSYTPPNGPEDHRVALDKKKFNTPQDRYIQVFSDKNEFVPNLSILDLLLNEGPLARNYITQHKYS